MLQIPPRAPESPPPLDNLYRDVPYESRARSGSRCIDLRALMDPRFRRCSACIAARAFLAAIQRFTPAVARPLRIRSHVWAPRPWASTLPARASTPSRPSHPGMISGGINASLYSRRLPYVQRVAINTPVCRLFSLARRYRRRGQEERSVSERAVKMGEGGPLSVVRAAGEVELEPARQGRAHARVAARLGHVRRWVGIPHGGWARERNAVVGLDYKNAYLEPHREFQRMKHHPHFHALLAAPGADRLRRSAGVINTAKIKGTHNAMRLAVALMSHFLSFTAHHPSIYFFYSYFPFPALFYPASARCSNPTRTGIPRRRSHTPPPPRRHFRFVSTLIVATFSALVASPSSPSSARFSPSSSDSNTPRSTPLPPTPPNRNPAKQRSSTSALNSTASTPRSSTAPTPPARTDLWTVGPPAMPRASARGQRAGCGYDIAGVGVVLENCIHCKLCDIKVLTQYIMWTIPGQRHKCTLT
ncbi:hypothetical protein DFH09DRAFT_1316518 [Mycena vulgaris]|nr:hypothetical protein DFH09DRAFT_1316518 [Mycena vulgaris]